MKRSYFLMMALSLGALSLQAQIDEVYYVPTAEQRAAEQAERTLTSSYSNLEERRQPADNWANGRRGNFDTDAYNRRNRSQVVDSTEAYAEDDWNCTTRLVRFHAPVVGVVVSSPYYMDYYDYWHSPLSYRYYDPFYSSWYGWGRPWYYSSWGWNSWAWNSWGWYDPWYSGWYAGWYGGYGWYGGWGWSYPRYWGSVPRYDYAWTDRNYRRGPVGGGRSFGVNNHNSNYSVRSNATRQTMPSRSYNNSNSSRTSGRYYNTQPTAPAPSRNYEMSQPRTYSAPSSSPTPRTYGGGGTVSGGRSTGSSGGGGRTFGR